jgi:glutathione peroxidase
MLRRAFAIGMAATLTAGGLAIGALAGMPKFAPDPAAAGAGPADFSFREIGGGTIELAAWRGRPVLVVNTASRCGFTRQYDDLQALYDRYRAAGLIVLGVPSNAFGQELRTAEAVRDFCEVNFDIDFPMTDLVELRGPRTHPFYEWAGRQGVVPSWNFHKILLDGEGRIAAAFPAQVAPLAPDVVREVERLLPRG